MNKEKAATIFAYVCIIIIIVSLFFTGYTVGVTAGRNEEPETTWSPDSNSIEFRKSIKVDGNIYVKGKIYNYKEK